MVDIDHYRAVNDAYDHDNGDIDRLVDNTLRNNVREINLAGRMSGEEFDVFIQIEL